MYSSSVCASYYKCLVGYVEDRGVGEIAMRSVMKWDPNQQLTSEGRLPSHFIKAILEMGERQFEDALFASKAGLHAGENTTSLLAFMLLSAPTLERAIGDICNYSSLLVSGITVGMAKGSKNEVVFRFKENDDFGGRSTFIFFVMSAWLAILKRDVENVKVVELSAPENINTGKGIGLLLRAEKFTTSDTFSLRIKFTDLKNKPSYADPEMHEELTLKADVAIVRLRCDNRFVEKVKRGISETLQSGPLTLGQVAKKLNVSERTLQRRLKEKNVRFNDVLDLTRQQSAKEYLLNTSVPLVDVASQLGFANSASFNRAFKRWFSETPNRFRYARHNVFQESLAIDGS
ncbi:AraC family transcriptional regulator [Zhongshania sp.]|uniref:AraC family transcriptional regulator n=1 Tax=Zhongshania sp. TaxID=1971902 RepID=UPI002A808833|nr:helix-turn-helix domain-containing protein [Zhongshania sp.]